MSYQTHSTIKQTTNQTANVNANTNRSFSDALRGSAQATRTLGQKGYAGSAMMESRAGLTIVFMR